MSRPDRSPASTPTPSLTRSPARTPSRVEALATAPSLELIGPTAPAWAVLAVAMLASAGVTVLAGGTTVGRSLLAVAALAMLLLRRGATPAVWFALVGLAVLTRDMPGGGVARIGWVVAVVLLTHLALVSVRLLENLDLRARVAWGVLRDRASTFWQAQAVAQLVGVAAWLPVSGAVPILAVAAMVGAGVLAVVVLRRL